MELKSLFIKKLIMPGGVNTKVEGHLLYPFSASETEVTSFIIYVRSESQEVVTLSGCLS